VGEIFLGVLVFLVCTLMLLGAALVFLKIAVQIKLTWADYRAGKIKRWLDDY